jgi:acetyl esterase
MAVARAISSMPPAVTRLLAGSPVEVDGQLLEAEAQFAQRLTGSNGRPDSVAERRAKTEHDARVFTGPRVEAREVRNLEVAGADGRLPARLYVGPDAPTPSPLLVYFHGGGWTTGSLDSHDNLCRFLARDAAIRVLSVAYRLAPEAPFPAAPDDCLASFEDAVARAAELDADAARIAVGGDSAGGNLAAVVSIDASRSGGPKPCLQLLIYPVTQIGDRSRRSYSLFGSGYYLTEADMDFYDSCYLTDAAKAEDPRVSPLRCEDLTGLPRAIVVAAGFDPLRDEVLEYAERLREAGVEVDVHRVPGLPHGFANVVAAGRAAPAAMRGVASALANALAT